MAKKRKKRKQRIRLCPFCDSNRIQINPGGSTVCKSCGARARSLMQWNMRMSKHNYLMKLKRLRREIISLRNCENCYRKSAMYCDIVTNKECLSNNYKFWLPPSNASRAKVTRECLDALQTSILTHTCFVRMQNCLNCAYLSSSASSQYCPECKHHGDNYRNKNAKNNWQSAAISVYESRLRNEDGLDVNLFDADI